ncbi:DUF1858 domain-containing protein [Candidatus Woesearchaeota archaeon]|nr:DUF1858 domain-containing protein [Candidatus Woesearchaeota archaeon]
MEEKKITRKSTLGEAIVACPEAGKIMFEYGLHCIGCHIAATESIEDGCKVHGLSDEQIDEMVERINKAIEKSSSDEESKGE